MKNNKIKRMLIPLLLIILLTSMMAFGASVPIGPNFNDSVLEYGNDGLTIKSGGITHLLLAPDIITGLTDVTSTDSDFILIADESDSWALKKVSMDEVRGAGGGYTNLTSFVDQTAWRVFYSNTAGDVTELALGTDGTYLGSNGATSAPTFTTPSGAGDMLKAVYDVDQDGDIDVSSGGTEKTSWTQYCIPYLSGTQAFGEIAIGTAEYALTVNAGANGYDWTELNFAASGANTDITSILNTGLYIGRDADNQIKFSTDNKIVFRINAGDKAEMISTGELDMNAGSVGFTLQSTTGDGTTTIDWKLGNKFKFTFGSQNDTLTFTAPTNPCTLMLTLIQDATGSRTITWPATVKWAGGTEPTLTTTANARDKVALDWDGTQYDGTCSKDFK